MEVYIKIIDFSKKSEINRLLKILKFNNIKLICLAGFLRILSKYFIKSFKGKIINIHPSLLPRYKGLNTHERVLKKNEKFTGCSVHFVNEKLDYKEVSYELWKKKNYFMNSFKKKST